MENCLITSKRLLGALDIPFTQEFLKEKVLTHPQCPSLLSISDTVEEYGVESMAVKLGPDRLGDFPAPGIVQVSLANGTFFNVVTAVSENSVSVFDEKGRQKDIPRLDFLRRWTGVGLLVEAREGAGEPGIGQKEKTIRHLLAIASKGDPKFTHQALDDWYGAEKKDYAGFAANYPMNGELLLQEEKIKQMGDWCGKENISYTPTLFINGYELLKDYKVEDLHYVLV